MLYLLSMLTDGCWLASCNLFNVEGFTMADAVWTTATEATTVSVKVGEETHDVEVGESFADAMKELANDASIETFRVLNHGNELTPSTAPSSVEAGMSLEIVPYHKAGQLRG